MKLVVTGGSGFLGGYVLREAARRGHETVALARSEAAAAAGAALGATPVSGNLDDGRSLDHAFITARCDALINLASLGFGHAPAIVTAAELAGLSRAVFVSTTAITTTLPARSKRIRLAAEERVRASALDGTILRPPLAYGDRGARNPPRRPFRLPRAPVPPVPGGGHR